jgi:DNA-directed RNA polymerase subunit D
VEEGEEGCRLMKAELVESKENKISMNVSGVDLAFMNAVRRYCMGRVQILAIDSITMYENTSSMFDEYVTHRIGLIPLITPKGVKEGMEVAFSLDESGPKVVYSGDLKTTDKDVKVAKEMIPIITLFEGQNLRLEGKAVASNGRTHAKFQSGLAAYGEGEKGNVVFKAESFFQMSPKEMLVRGCKQLEEDLSVLGKSVKKAK